MNALTPLQSLEPLGLPSSCLPEWFACANQRQAALLAVQVHNASGGSPIRRVACPGLGTAIGRMAPDVCARQMRAAFDAVVLGRTPQLPTLQDAKLWHVQLTRADL